MKIKLLGTGGSEGIPAIFCNCPICVNAKKKKGKEIRKRSGAIINGELMIDFPPDILSYICDYNLDITKIKYLLVTHSHSDHLCLDDLAQRNQYVSKDRQEEVLSIYGNSAVIELVKDAMVNNGAMDSAMYTSVCGDTKFNCGEYTVLPIKSKHMKSEESLLYIITKGNKTVFYCTDTDVLDEEQFKILASENIKIDCAIFDCTFGKVDDLPKSLTEGHLNIYGVEKIANLLKKYQLVKEDAKYVLTHIAHSGMVTHEQLENLANEYGFIAGFDGFEINLD